MRLSYRTDGRLREAELHDVDSVDVTDCTDTNGKHAPFISIDLERGSGADKMSVGGYLTIEAARNLRDALVKLELGD